MFMDTILYDAIGEMIKARFALTIEENTAEKKVMVRSTTRSKGPMIRV